MRVAFVKMEGCGNDYVFVDGISTPLLLDRAPEFARQWSDRHFGIGADGLIVLLRGDDAPVRMAMWNADGSRGAMCGNGLRCLARFAFELGHVDTRAFAVGTDAGSRHVELLANDQVRAEIGAVVLGAPRSIALADGTLEIVSGSVGNPHATLFVADVQRAPVARIGAALQTHPDFPGGVNVEFVEVLAVDRLRQRTFERGSGETLACGTGAAFAAAVARRRGAVTGDRVQVELAGGTLTVLAGGASLAIEGPARTVYRGEIELSP